MDNNKSYIVSILGDSISTFRGFVPEYDGVNLAHRCRYPQDNLITDVNDTWWMKILFALDATLGVNDSWAGSTVSNTLDGNERDFGVDAAMASVTRIKNLGANGEPDIIFFYGGTNDAGKMINKGVFYPQKAPTITNLESRKWGSFVDAYCEAICRLRYFYPNSKIVALTPSFSNGYYDNDRLSEFSDIIIEICNHYSVRCIDLRKSGITYDMLPDGLHPNREGMECIYTAIINDWNSEK